MHMFMCASKQPKHTHMHAHMHAHRKVGVLTVHVADLAVLDCWKDTWKACSPG